jgi:DNA-binding GntR family transcriptional regulator
MRPLEERRSVVEAAAERIREAILEGVYGQAEKLSDSRIAQELGVSRGSIREALKLLQAQGLVVQKPNRGAYVTAVTAADIREAYELRAALESHAARLLAARHCAADLALLRRLVAEMEAAARNGDQLAVSQLDREFHQSLFALAGNRRLREVFDREILNTVGFFAVDAQAFRPLSDMGREFRALVEAIADADEDAAARLIAAHVRRATDLLAEQIEATRESPPGDQR